MFIRQFFSASDPKLLNIDLISAVKYQMNLYGDNLKEGDVLMTNSPHPGGSYVNYIHTSFSYMLAIFQI